MITELIQNLNQNGIAYGIVCALSAWLGKVWAGRIADRQDLEIQKQLAVLKADLESAQKKLSGAVETSVHVHKVQFEKEFGIYQELMKNALRFHLAFFTLHKALQPVHESESEAEAYYRPLRENVFNGFEVLRATIRENRPFYAEDVFRRCGKLLDLALDDVASLKTRPGTGFLTFAEMETMKKDVDAAFDAVVEGIRDRLNSVIVVE